MFSLTNAPSCRYLLHSSAIFSLMHNSRAYAGKAIFTAEKTGVSEQQLKRLMQMELQELSWLDAVYKADPADAVASVLTSIHCTARGAC